MPIKRQTVNERAGKVKYFKRDRKRAWGKWKNTKCWGEGEGRGKKKKKPCVLMEKGGGGGGEGRKEGRRRRAGQERKVWAYLTGQASARSPCRRTEEGRCADDRVVVAPRNDSEERGWRVFFFFFKVEHKQINRWINKLPKVNNCLRGGLGNIW